MLERFLPRIEFDSYEDFSENYAVNPPENFNFGFDIIDEWGKQDKNKRALVWCDDELNKKTYTFKDAMELSNKAANFFVNQGIKKGDIVMLI